MKENIVNHNKPIIESYHSLSKEILTKMNTLSPFDVYDLLFMVENEEVKEILKSILDLQTAYHFMNFLDMYDDTPPFSLDALLIGEFNSAKRNGKIPFDINESYLNCILKSCKDVLNNVGTISACAEHQLSVYMKEVGSGFSEIDIEKLKLCIREILNPNKKLLIEQNNFEIRNKVSFYDIFGTIQEYDYFTIGKHLYFTRWFENILKTENYKWDFNLLPPSKTKFEYISIAEQYIEDNNSGIYALPF